MERKWLIAIPILIVLLLLCAAMTVVSVIATRRLSSADGLFVYGLAVHNISAERDDEQSFDVRAPSQLVVENVCGAVDVRAGSDGVIRYKAHVTAWGRNAEDAQKALKEIEIDAVQDGDTLRIGLKNPDQVCSGRTRRPPSVDISIEAPAQTAAQLRTSAGSVSLVGLERDAQLHTDFGSITVRDLTGALLAESNNGEISVNGVDAGAGSVQLTSQFGRVQIDDLSAASLTVESVNGGADVRRAAVTGSATVHSVFGNVTWYGGQAGALEITSQNGGLTLEDLEVSKTVTLSSDFGGVNLAKVRAGRYEITTKNGDIEVDGASGDIQAHSEFGNVSVSAGSAVHIDLKSSNGTVTYEGSLTGGENALHSSFGTIRVVLPADAAFSFDLETKFGDIHSDFPTQIEGTPDENHWRGTVGGGGDVMLTASTDNGNITLEAKQ